MLATLEASNHSFNPGTCLGMGIGAPLVTPPESRLHGRLPTPNPAEPGVMLHPRNAIFYPFKVQRLVQPDHMTTCGGNAGAQELLKFHASPPVCNPKPSTMKSEAPNAAAGL
jgi:hypothetical protein